MLFRSKTERNLSDLSAEKRKRKGNMETETEFCKTETKTEKFMRKRKQIRNSVFRRNYHGNGISVSGNTELSVLLLMNTFRPNQKPCLGRTYTCISWPLRLFPIHSLPIHHLIRVRTIHNCCLSKCLVSS